MEHKTRIINFEDIPASTNTFVVMSNLIINMDKMFDFLPITDYIIVPKKRGRKKKIQTVDPNKDIKEGSIITIKFGNNIRGVVLKKRKKNKNSDYSYFRNSMTVIMIIEDKMINFKISRNGKFQMTGCRNIIQAEKCIKYIWEYIKDNNTIFSIPKNENFTSLFIPAMRNIDFNLGFPLNREKLDEYINNNTLYYSLFETSIGYTGVNIKIPILKPIKELQISELVYEDEKWNESKLVSYEKYLNNLKPKEKEKKLEQKRYNTFLVFHSGKVIMTSMCSEYAKDTYYEFINLIYKNKDKFIEKLE
jgi:TATA-box binding protein (TBP) (component of TFIID and TFIIIB)